MGSQNAGYGPADQYYAPGPLSGGYGSVSSYGYPDVGSSYSTPANNYDTPYPPSNKDHLSYEYSYTEPSSYESSLPPTYRPSTMGGEPGKVKFGGLGNRFTPGSSGGKPWQKYDDMSSSQYGGGYGEYTSSGTEYSGVNTEPSYRQNNNEPLTYGRGYGQYGKQSSDTAWRGGGSGYSGHSGDNGWGSSGRGGSRGGRGRGRGRGDGAPHGSPGRGRGRFDRGGRGKFGTGGRGRGGMDQMGGGSGPNGGQGRGRGGVNQAGGPGAQEGGRGRGRGTRGGRGQQDGVRGRGRGFVASNNVEWKKKATNYKVALEGDRNFISFKNSLQEHCQKLHKPVPQYSVTKAELGFHATVNIDSVVYSSLTSHRERKDAELGAAFEALKGLGVISGSEKYNPKGKKRLSNEESAQKPKMPKPDTSVITGGSGPVSYKAKLHELCQKMKYTPTFTCTRTAGGFICTVVLNGQVYQSSMPCGTKKLAEHNASQVVLSQVDFTPPVTKKEESQDESNAAVITPITNTAQPDNTPSNTTTFSSPPPPSRATKPSPTPRTPKTPPTPDTPSDVTTPTQPSPVQKSMKNIVQEYCQKNGMSIPTYTTIKDSGLNIATINVNGKEFVGTPHILKKTAEQNAAKRAIEELKLK